MEKNTNFFCQTYGLICILLAQNYQISHKQPAEVFGLTFRKGNRLNILNVFKIKKTENYMNMDKMSKSKVNVYTTTCIQTTESKSILPKSQGEEAHEQELHRRNVQKVAPVHWSC